MISSAQSALSCHEIAAIVFECLSPGPRPTEDASRSTKRQRKISQKTLASAAQACRALTEPALDVLWRNVDDFVHLLSILPFIQPQGRTNLNEPFIFEAFTSTEWTRFQRYAYRVRNLHMGKQDIHKSVWQVLNRRCSSHAALLPQLRRLNTLRCDDDILAKIILFSPNLRELGLTFTPESQSLDLIPMTPEEMRPAIERVKVLTVDGQVRAFPTFLKRLDIWSLAHLHSLNLALEVCITPPIVRKIAAFPHLEQLSLRFILSDVADNQHDQHPITSFPALRSLTLNSSLRDINTFLETACPTALQSFTVHITDAAAENQPIDILGCLGPALRTLKVFWTRCYIFHDLSNLFPTLSEYTGLRELVLACRGI
ncbi:hypothetical protein C8Q74DRAFT_1445672, partial [Fomes fomentarius]